MKPDSIKSLPMPESYACVLLKIQQRKRKSVNFVEYSGHKAAKSTSDNTVAMTRNIIHVSSMVRNTVAPSENLTMPFCTQYTKT